MHLLGNRLAFDYCPVKDLLNKDDRLIAGEHLSQIELRFAVIPEWQYRPSRDHRPKHFTEREDVKIRLHISKPQSHRPSGHPVTAPNILEGLGHSIYTFPLER